MMASSRDKSEGGGGGSSTLTITAPPPPGSRPHLPIGGPPQRPPGHLSARPLSNGSALTSHQSGLRASPVPMSGPAIQKPSPGSAVSAGTGTYGGSPSDSNSADSDKSLKMKIKRTKSGQLKTEDFKSQQSPHTNGNSDNSSSRPSSPSENGITGKLSLVTSANTVLPTPRPRGGKVSKDSSSRNRIMFSLNLNQTVYPNPSSHQVAGSKLTRNFYHMIFLFRNFGNQKIVSKNFFLFPHRYEL